MQDRVGVLLYDADAHKEYLSYVSLSGEILSQSAFTFDPFYINIQSEITLFPNGNLGFHGYSPSKSGFFTVDANMTDLNFHSGHLERGSSRVLLDGSVAVGETRVSTTGISFLDANGKFIDHVQTVDNGLGTLAIAQLNPNTIVSLTSEAEWWQGMGIFHSAAYLPLVDLISKSTKGTHRIEIPHRPKGMAYKNSIAGPHPLGENRVLTAYGLTVSDPHTAQVMSRETVLVASDLTGCF